MSHVSPLTRARHDDVPACCTDCVFWQSVRSVNDAGRRERWDRETEVGFGAFGRVLYEGDAFRGLLQYGPAHRFPRARALPAGPPSAEAALITCSYVSDDDPAGACERLLLEALADLKARQFTAVEAFAVRHDGDAPLAERVAGHHTLFDAELLEGLGFSEVRQRGTVALMRLSLGGLIPAPRLTAAERARGAMARAGTAIGSPAPA